MQVGAVHRLSVQLQGQGYILLGGEDGDQVIELEDEAHLAAAEKSQVVFLTAEDVGAVDQHPAGGRAVHRAQHMEQR